MTAALTIIAQQHLGLDTLETRRSDSLDFHDLAVWQIRKALQAAYDAGAEVKTAQLAGQHGLSEDQLCVSILDIELIKAAAIGRVDLNELARKRLADCGLDLDGKWVGFKAAATA
jgi:hypothetical protein